MSLPLPPVVAMSDRQKDDEGCASLKYPPNISALWKPKICGIIILGIAGGKTFDLGLRFELDWSENLQNVSCVVTRSSAASLRWPALTVLLYLVNLGNPRRYSFPGFFGLKYWPGLHFPVPTALESSSNSPLPTAPCLSVLPSHPEGNLPFSFHLFCTGNSFFLSSAASSFL